jgi:hypothetical protein
MRPASGFTRSSRGAVEAEWVRRGNVEVRPVIERSRADYRVKLGGDQASRANRRGRCGRDSRDLSGTRYPREDRRSRPVRRRPRLHRTIAIPREPHAQDRPLRHVATCGERRPRAHRRRDDHRQGHHRQATQVDPSGPGHVAIAPGQVEQSDTKGDFDPKTRPGALSMAVDIDRPSPQGGCGSHPRVIEPNIQSSSLAAGFATMTPPGQADGPDVGATFRPPLPVLGLWAAPRDAVSSDLVRSSMIW